MNTFKVCPLISLLVGGLFPFIACAQGAFENLDFESADVTDSTPVQGIGYVPISAALPGWTAYLGNNETTQILYNNFTLGAVSVDLEGTQFLSGGYVIDGNYSVVLQFGGPPATGADASIAQIGTVPINAESLLFKAWGTPNFSVSFAGTSLSPVVVSTGQGEFGQTYNEYGVNIASYAGVTGQLEFSADQGNLVLDDIAFSPTAVPEPGIVALTAIGGLLFGARKRFARR
jgi:hypothetical protein